VSVRAQLALGLCLVILAPFLMGAVLVLYLAVAGWLRDARHHGGSS
jgi:hypothetical protein